MGLHNMVMRADTLAHFENVLKIKTLTYPRASDKMIIRRCVLVFLQAGAFFLPILKFFL
jgi:hypothetical protein